MRHKREPEFISLDDAALMLDVHRRTIRRWISAGKLRGYQYGPQIVRVRANDVRALLEPIPTAKQ